MLEKLLVLLCKSLQLRFDRLQLPLQRIDLALLGLGGARGLGRRARGQTDPSPTLRRDERLTERLEPTL